MKKYSLHENTENKKNTEKLAKYVAKIHAQKIDSTEFKKYNAEWVAEQVEKINDVQTKNDITLALKTMSQIESHRVPVKKYSFLAWDISRSDWHQDYKSGGVGSYAWDIACIINCANNAQFSKIFLQSYLRHGGEKPTIVGLHTNLYYVQLMEAIKSHDFENIMQTTRKIIDDTIFKTDLISHAILIELGITGY